MKAQASQLFQRLLCPLQLLILMVLVAPMVARATVITGNIVNQANSSTYTVTDGTNSAAFFWSEYIFGSSAYVYATANTDVALATGVTNVTQITGAGSYTFLTSPSYLTDVSDANANGGIGQFVLLRSHSGHYAVVRVDSLTSSTINATWWFQTDGTANFSSFVQPAGTLGQALNATNLTWTTSGHSNWFSETTNSLDGMAAQSGTVTGVQSSVLSTTITGPGTLTFWWSTVTPPGDTGFDIEFDLDGSDWDDIFSGQSWTQEPAISLSAGPHTLSWTAFAGNHASDAGFVDEVQFTPPTVVGPVSATFDLVIERNDNDVDGHFHYYSAIPELTYITPAPTTIHRVESSDGLIYGEVFEGSTSFNTGGSASYPTLADLIFACTNQPWKLYIDQGDPGEEDFHFNVSISGLTTNLIFPVTLIAPTLNATNVATNTPFQWSGPKGYTSLFVNAYQLPSFTSYGGMNLPSSATNWPSPPALNYGTNGFTLVYTSNNFPNVTSSTPVDTNLNPVASWSTSVDLQIVTEIPFVVGQPAPLPVQIGGAGSVPPSTGTNGFQFGFQTLAGRNHIIQMRTNLVSGTWTDVTNFIGNGSAIQLSFPITNSPGKYFRIITQ